ncbi:MAG: hypothetical protein KTR31_39165 [Myxococcales bacterium]|nr:hypothetical protein [Myxococcales bacterium]
MIHRIAAFGMVALVAGCEGDLTDTKDSGDTGETTGCVGGPFTGPVVIAAANISCVDDNTVLFEMSTDGIASDGLVFSQETANPTPNFSDEHSLAVVDSDAECGTFTDLERELSTGIVNFETDVSTLFRCDESAGGDPYHHNAVVMTYAFRAYDSTGAFADCVIAGENPTALRDGTIKRVNEPANPSEIASCDIEKLTY